MAELKNIRIAVSGIYDYAKEEIPTLRIAMPGQGAPEWVEDKRIYKVYRPAAVLAQACDKFANLPLTHHHPRTPVDGANFRDLAIGWTGANPSVDYISDTNEVGIRSTCMLYDDEALKAYDNGEVQLSPGYIAVFDWQKGTDPHGNEYDIVMKEITDVNHVALLPNGRGGEYAVVMDTAAKTETIFDIVRQTMDEGNTGKPGGQFDNDNASKDHESEEDEKNKMIRKPQGKVTQDFVNVAKECGFDFTDYNHETTNYFETHVIKEHGKGNENDPANIPIETSDFDKIQEIINEPDFIAFGVKRDGEDRVIYAKSYPDNTTLYFEEILDGKKNKKLRGKTMFKRAEKVDSEKLKTLLKSNKKNDISGIKIACTEVTDSSISRSINGVGGQTQRHAGKCKFIVLDDFVKSKSIFEIARGSVFDRVKEGV